ncbi:hypothetical protein HK097_010507 [Rhizophlyctis rosea]|uniref:Restriction of telomere capping protein 4 n=1 Tax=Rhizophlyctis rosea TaxID=64517 RepID=A0AAD5S7J7_9FUNG|nr:hypothetical protein HK097_010507 [Rhizophlyctis rosea]
MSGTIGAGYKLVVKKSCEAGSGKGRASRPISYSPPRPAKPPPKTSASPYLRNSSTSRPYALRSKSSFDEKDFFQNKPSSAVDYVNDSDYDRGSPFVGRDGVRAGPSTPSAKGGLKRQGEFRESDNGGRKRMKIGGDEEGARERPRMGGKVGLTARRGSREGLDQFVIERRTSGGSAEVGDGRRASRINADDFRTGGRQNDGDGLKQNQNDLGRERRDSRVDRAERANGRRSDSRGDVARSVNSNRRDAPSNQPRRRPPSDDDIIEISESDEERTTSQEREEKKIYKPGTRRSNRIAQKPSKPVVGALTRQLATGDARKPSTVGATNKGNGRDTGGGQKMFEKRPAGTSGQKLLKSAAEPTKESRQPLQRGASFKSLRTDQGKIITTQQSPSKPSFLNFSPPRKSTNKTTSNEAIKISELTATTTTAHSKRNSVGRTEPRFLRGISPPHKKTRRHHTHINYLNDHDSDSDSAPTSSQPDASTTSLSNCPHCSKPLPDPLPTHVATWYKKLKKEQPREWEHEFCKYHRVELEVIPEGVTKGWPYHIDWERVKERVKAMEGKLREVVDGRVGSAWRRIWMGEYFRLGARRAQASTNRIGRVRVTGCGYYGTKGARMILEILSGLFLNQMHPYLTAQKSHPQPVLEYLQDVLVPECAARLVMEDLGITYEEARNVMKKSLEFGKVVGWEPEGEEEEEGGPSSGTGTEEMVMTSGNVEPIWVDSGEEGVEEDWADGEVEFLEGGGTNRGDAARAGVFQSRSLGLYDFEEPTGSRGATSGGPSASPSVASSPARRKGMEVADVGRQHYDPHSPDRASIIPESPTIVNHEIDAVVSSEPQSTHNSPLLPPPQQEKPKRKLNIRLPGSSPPPLPPPKYFEEEEEGDDVDVGTTSPPRLLPQGVDPEFFMDDYFGGGGSSSGGYHDEPEQEGDEEFDEGHSSLFGRRLQEEEGGGWCGIAGVVG